jgi:hypothetical protein
VHIFRASEQLFDPAALSAREERERKGVVHGQVGLPGGETHAEGRLIETESH